MAETVQKLVGNVEIDYLDVRAGDFKGKVASGERAFNELGWKPKVDLEEGIGRYIDWYKTINKL